MLCLSETAKQFLRSSKRRRHISDRKTIESDISRQGLPVFDPVVDFQREFGGYVLYAGLAPVVLGITFPVLSVREERHRKSRKVMAEKRDGKWFFESADTLYQLTFEIDQDGVWYEDFDPVAESVHALIEQHAALGWIC